ncbi:MAG: carboxy-S-adenosyl-L-methionine synthase CmoA [Pseudomonadota bacterium]
MIKDTLFDSEAAGRVQFRFDDTVARVFPDMINRSVPGYAATLDGIALIAHQVVRPSGKVYDLGCTLGAALLATAQGIGDRPATLVGVDNSAAMIDRCKADARFIDRPQRFEFELADLETFEFEAADLIILSYTLQFLKPAARGPLLQRIFDALRPGGALVLAEKFCFDDTNIASRMTNLHHDFKRAHHYSDLEIAGKRAALEDVLIAETREAHLDRLTSIGFKEVVLWHAAINFGAFLAIRPDD